MYQGQEGLLSDECACISVDEEDAYIERILNAFSRIEHLNSCSDFLIGDEFIVKTDL